MWELIKDWDIKKKKFKKKYIYVVGQLCSTSSAEKLFSHLVRKTCEGQCEKAVVKEEGCFVWRYKGFEMLQEWIDEPVPR